MTRHLTKAPKRAGRSILIVVTTLLLAASMSCAADTTDVQPKSYGVAYTLAITGTIMPVVGITVGPGLGHLYAGNTKQFWIGTGLRTVGWAGFIVAVALTWENPDSQIGAIGGFSGLGLALVSTVYDIATTGRSVRQYNEKHAQPAISFVPACLNGSGTPGIRVTLHF